MSDEPDFNTAIINEFRANEGKVGGYFAGRPLLLLHTVGAKSGQTRVSPLAFVHDDDTLIVLASKAGADTNPAWYYNLLANPTVEVELGTEHFQAKARAVTEEPERSQLFAKMVAEMPGFAEYEQKTKRKIPAIVLKRLS